MGSVGDSLYAWAAATRGSDPSAISRASRRTSAGVGAASRLAALPARTRRSSCCTVSVSQSGTGSSLASLGSLPPTSPPPSPASAANRLPLRLPSPSSQPRSLVEVCVSLSRSPSRSRPRRTALGDFDREEKKDRTRDEVLSRSRSPSVDRRAAVVSGGAAHGSAAPPSRLSPFALSPLAARSPLVARSARCSRMFGDDAQRRKVEGRSERDGRETDGAVDEEKEEEAAREEAGGEDEVATEEASRSRSRSRARSASTRTNRLGDGGGEADSGPSERE
mmetsp:Transcript_1095/g.3364  ORF Transcript_1095/g.3364 Transcript_1095/m.3364 type:complete len:278 (+) Transcript_1095:708-1541(+)